jgi:HEAT repeat protein
MRRDKMAEYPEELKKLAEIATDFGLSADLRKKATEQLGNIGTHEALLILLELAANTELSRNEREFALKQARDIIKSTGK